MRVGVVGCGIAGASTAFLLAEQGHQVTLFEQAPHCGPVGAGILLQPSGLSILRQQGLLDDVLASSAQIDSLHARHRDGGTLVYLSYSRLNLQLFGVGILRGELFRLLFDRCRSAGVNICEGVQICSFEQDDRQARLADASGAIVGQFDLIVAADGSRSRLRTHSQLITSVTEYDDAALWVTGPFDSVRNQLLQFVHTDGRLVGLLPVGGGRCSFFWGLQRHEWEDIQAQGIDHWRHQVAQFYAPAAAIVDSLTTLDDVAFATYRHVRTRRVLQGRVVFVGDAAHATSPHLGQGANLALADAACLAQQIGSGDDWKSGLHRYARQRAAATRFYSQLTAVLTPFFQTRSRIHQLARNLALPLMPHLPYVGRQMVVTMAGLKSGWLSESAIAPLQIQR